MLSLFISIFSFLFLFYYFILFICTQYSNYRPLYYSGGGDRHRHSHKNNWKDIIWERLGRAWFHSRAKRYTAFKVEKSACLKIPRKRRQGLFCQSEDFRPYGWGPGGELSVFRYWTLTRVSWQGRSWEPAVIWADFQIHSWRSKSRKEKKRSKSRKGFSSHYSHKDSTHTFYF